MRLIPGFLLLGLLGQAPPGGDSGAGSIHPIDRAFLRLWKERGLAPAPTCLDSEFQRRVTLDLLGRIPTPEESRRFLACREPRKREAWTNEILESPELAPFWGERLASIMVGYPQDDLGVSFKPMLSRWIAACLQAGKGYDEIVGELVRSGSGRFPPSQGPDVAYPTFATVLVYQDGRGDRFEQLLGRTARVFLGVPLHCAQCHDHPRGRWTREDYEGMLGFYGRLESYNRAPEEAPRKWAPPVFLDGSTPREGFRRMNELARLLVRPENVRFSRTAANRFWAHFMGWGLEEPLDDLDDGRPGAVPGLLEELAAIFTREGFHLKPFFRLLTSSRVYQQSSRSGAASGTPPLAGARIRSLSAEQLWGAILTATGPRLEAKAREALRRDFIRMIVRSSGGEGSSGNSNEPLATQQMLRLADVESPFYGGARAGGGGRLDQILELKLPPEDKVREIYAAVLSRPPEPQELSRCLRHAAETAESPAGWSELFWALLASNEFFFNH